MNTFERFQSSAPQQAQNAPVPDTSGDRMQEDQGPEADPNASGDRMDEQNNIGTPVVVIGPNYCSTFLGFPNLSRL